MVFSLASSAGQKQWMQGRTRLALFCALFSGILLLSLPEGAFAQSATQLKEKGDLMARRGDVPGAERAYRAAVAADPRSRSAVGALATHLLRQSKYAAAAQLLAVFLRADGTYADGWYSLAYARRKAGRHRMAVIAYLQYAKLRPKSPDPHYGLALAYKALKKYAEAAASFSRYALMERDKAKRAWVNKALAEAVKMETARRAAGKRKAPPAVAAKSKPPVVSEGVKLPVVEHRKTEPETQGPLTAARRRARALKQQGDKAMQQRQFEAAARSYRRAIGEDYTYTVAYNELGGALFALKRYDKAVRVFRIALRDNPHYELGWYNLAYALRKLGRYPESVVAYKKFARKRPQDPDPHLGLGLTYQAMGNKRAAVAAYNGYIRLERRASYQRMVQQAKRAIVALGGQVTSAAGAKAEAKPAAQPGAEPTAKKAGPGKLAPASGAKKPLPADILAKALGAAGRPVPGAAADAKAAREPSPKERRRLARVERKRKAQQARQLRAEQAKARRAEARRRRAEARKARVEKLRQRREARKRKAEQRKLARLERIRLRREARELKRAEARRRKAEAAQKRQAAKLAKAGPPKAGGTDVNPRAVGKQPVARVALPPGVKAEPDRPSAIPAPPKPLGVGTTAAARLRVQGDSLARIGKCQAATPLYRRALKADPFHTRAYDGLAFCAQRSQHYDAGIRLLAIGLRDNPDYQRGWLHLARLRDTAGLTVAAIGSYRRYLRARPRDADAHFELARCLRHAGKKAAAVASYQSYLRDERRQTKAGQSRRAAAYAELRKLGVEPSASGPGLLAAGAVRKSAKPDTVAPKPLPTDVFAKALAAAKGEPSGGKAPQKLSAKEQRRLAQQKKLEDRRIAREQRRAARLERLRQRKEARQKKLALARQRREAKQAARRERRRLRKEAAQKKREARLAARRRKAERAREDRMLAKLARSAKTRKAKRVATVARHEGTMRSMVRDLDRVQTTRVPRISDRLRPAPEAARGLMDVADGQFANKRYVVAMGIYRQAAKLDPSASAPLYKAGVCAVVLRRMQLAAGLFAQVLELDPGNATARTNLEMARAAAAGAGSDPAAQRVLLDQARQSLQAGGYAAAERSSTLLLKAGADPRAYLLRAEARVALRRGKLALVDAGRALALRPADPAALRVIGDAQRQLGDNTRALYYYRLFLTRTSGTDTPQRRAVEQAANALASQVSEPPAKKAAAPKVIRPRRPKVPTEKTPTPGAAPLKSSAPLSKTPKVILADPKSAKVPIEKAKLIVLPPKPDKSKLPKAKLIVLKRKPGKKAGKKKAVKKKAVKKKAVKKKAGKKRAPPMKPAAPPTKTP